MKGPGRVLLLVAAGCSVFVAVLHVSIAIAGPAWYRYFGAPSLAARIEAGAPLVPTLLALAVAAVFVLWACYALSGAGAIRHLPLLRTALFVIAGGVPRARGTGGAGSGRRGARRAPWTVCGVLSLLRLCRRGLPPGRHTAPAIERCSTQVTQSARVLVLGGTGHYGRHIVRSLAAKGVPVRVLTRNVARASGVLPETVELTEGDLESPDAVARALQGIDRVVVAVSAFTRDQIRRMVAVERDAVIAALDQAEAAGVRRVVYVSVFDVQPRQMPRQGHLDSRDGQAGRGDAISSRPPSTGRSSAPRPRWSCSSR